jgi:hypothetical protein
MKQTEAALREAGFEAIRTPFGWFNSLDIHAKGHRISRVARVISA